MFVSFARETVVVVEPVIVEQRGKKVRTYPDTGVSVAGCSVQPGASSEDTALRENVTIRWTVFMPPNVRVSAYSKVIVRGRAYQVEGEPQEWRSPTGRVSHVAVYLVDWKG